MKATVAVSAPLTGIQVVVTRAEESSGPLTRELASRGADVLHWPVLRFEPPEDVSSLRDALARLAEYDGIVFTSPRAVDAVSSRVSPPASRTWVAAVGESTRQALRTAGWRVDRVPAKAQASELAGELVDLVAATGCRRRRVLFPASSIARNALPHALRQLGAEVDRVTAYRTVLNDSLDSESCLADLDKETISILTFASPSAVAGLKASLGDEVFASVLSAYPAAAIGETTAAALESEGVRPTAVATVRTMAGLAEAVVQIARRTQGG